MEQQAIAWISSHLVWIFLGYLVFMALVQTAPKPTEKTSTAYLWFYGFIHALSMNLGVVAKLLKVNLPAQQPVEETSQQQGPKA